MKNFAASSAMLLCSLAPATAEPPFFPFPDVVDHVVTMTVNPGWGAGSDNGKIITHRGGRTRVDLTENGRSWASYFDRTDSKSVTVLRQSSGEYLSVVIRRGFEHHKGFDYRSFDTGERQVVLGESCSVWNVMRSTDFIELTKLSCVTDDGIELWFKVIGRLGIVRSGDATRIERRTVQPNEVSPPADLSLPKSWVERTEPVATVAPADFEVVMETADTPKTTRTTRRHYPWTYTEDPQRGGRRTVSIVNDATGLKMHFESNASGDVKALTIIPPLERFPKRLNRGIPMAVRI
jgi:hypothetical protein